MKAVRNGPPLYFILTTEVPQPNCDSPARAGGEMAWWKICDQFWQGDKEVGRVPHSQVKVVNLQSLSSLPGYSNAIEPAKKVKASLKCSQLPVGEKGTTKFHQINENTSSLFNLGL